MNGESSGPDVPRSPSFEELSRVDDFQNIDKRAREAAHAGKRQRRTRRKKVAEEPVAPPVDEPLAEDAAPVPSEFERLSAGNDDWTVVESEPASDDFTMEGEKGFAKHWNGNGRPERAREPEKSAEELLHDALNASPLAEAGIELEQGEDGRPKDKVWRDFENQLVMLRRAWITTKYNAWKGDDHTKDWLKTHQSGEVTRTNSEKEYFLAIAKLREMLATMKGFSNKEDIGLLVDAVVLRDMETLSTLRAALLSEKRRASAERSFKLVDIMPKKPRQLILAAIALVGGFLADPPWQKGELPGYIPTYEDTHVGERTGAERPPQAAEQASVSFDPVQVSSMGANQTFVRFFRILRYKNPAEFERLTRFAGGETKLLAIATQFSRATGFWRLSDSENRSAVLQEGDTVSFKDGHIVFTANGVDHPLTDDSGRPLAQGWLHF